MKLLMKLFCILQVHFILLFSNKRKVYAKHLSMHNFPSRLTITQKKPASSNCFYEVKKAKLKEVHQIQIQEIINALSLVHSLSAHSHNVNLMMFNSNCKQQGKQIWWEDRKICTISSQKLRLH